MIDNLKYADLIKLNGNLQMIKNVDYIENDFYKVVLKDMKSGRIREEIVNEKIMKILGVKLANIEYINSDKYYHYFMDKETKEELKFTIPFIGTDFEYIKGSKTKEFERRVLPVICNYYPNNIKKDSLVELSCVTSDAKIYYTLDGSEPNKQSILYDQPILIDENKLLRAVAYKDGYEKSYISDFNFYIKSRKTKIFLSPSRQNNNLGVAGSRYTTEMLEMNKLCDCLEAILSKYDVVLYRNTPETFIEDWSVINRRENIDCHLAIHSNATSGSWKKGVENWIHDEYSEAYSLANIIYDSVYSIYYDKSVFANRGVKYAKGSIAEASPAYFKMGMNLEVAYHDNIDDANWIIENRGLIASKIADALVSYFQLDFKNSN